MESKKSEGENSQFFNTYGLENPQPKLNMDSSERMQDIFRRTEEFCYQKYPGIQECLSLTSSVDYRTCKVILKDLEKCINEEKYRLMDDVNYFRRPIKGGLF